MSTTAPTRGGAPIAPSVERTGERRRVEWRETPMWSPIDQVAGMAEMVWRCARILVRRRPGVLAEVVRQAAAIVRVTAIPLSLCASLFMFGACAVLTLGVLDRIGAVDRYGFVAAIAGIREFNGWFSGMCVAGIAGTAVCADLASRKVRDELDAMLSIGIDPHEKLVLPRIIAITITTPMLFLLGSIVSVLFGAFTGQLFQDYSLATFVHSFSTYPAIDLLAAMVKMTLIGFAIGVVCCFKGLDAKGGPAGVGRAVNEAVVLAFTATWVLDLLCNTFALAAFPSAQTIR